jgi:hypothetical protein
MRRRIAVHNVNPTPNTTPSRVKYLERKVEILEEPTKGIDMHDLLNHLADIITEEYEVLDVKTANYVNLAKARAAMYEQSQAELLELSEKLLTCDSDDMT